MQGNKNWNSSINKRPDVLTVSCHRLHPTDPYRAKKAPQLHHRSFSLCTFRITWVRRMFSYCSHLAEQGHMTHKSLFALSLCHFPCEAFPDGKSSSKGQGERIHMAIKHRNPSNAEIASACLDICYIDFHFFLPGVITILATLPQFKRCSHIELWFSYLENF